MLKLTTLHPGGYAELASGLPCLHCQLLTRRAYPTWNKLAPFCNEECQKKYEDRVADELAAEMTIFERKQAD